VDLTEGCGKLNSTLPLKGSGLKLFAVRTGSTSFSPPQSPTRGLLTAASVLVTDNGKYAWPGKTDAFAVAAFLERVAKQRFLDFRPQNYFITGCICICAIRVRRGDM
jgi:hypothetical protein